MSDWIDEVKQEYKKCSDIMHYNRLDENFNKELSKDLRMSITRSHIRFNKYMSKLIPNKKVIFYIIGVNLMIEIVKDSDFLLAKDIARVTVFRLIESKRTLIYTNAKGKRNILGYGDILIDNKLIKKVSNSIYKCRIEGDLNIKGS